MDNQSTTFWSKQEEGIWQTFLDFSSILSVKNLFNMLQFKNGRRLKTMSQVHTLRKFGLWAINMLCEKNTSYFREICLS